MQSVENPEPRTAKIRPQGANRASTASAARTAAPDGDIVDRVWRLFCSMRLALILILLIAAAVFVGTIIDQAPGGLEPADYASWLARERIKYGPYADLFNALQLFIVYSSAWFKLLLAALMMNIVVCTSNRWNGIWTMVSRPRIKMNENYFRKAGKRATFTNARASVSDTAAVVEKVLAARRYRVLSQQEGDTTYLYADKNRYFKLGTFVSHLSFIILLAGIIVGSVFGFRELNFAVPEGSSRDVGYGTGLTVTCESFADEYFPEGPPKDYRSDLVLSRNGTEVARKTIHVNDPLEYNGVRFYQSYFGPAAVVQVKTKDGTTIFNDGVALSFRSGRDEKRALGTFDLPQQGMIAYIIAPRSGETDAQIPAGEVRVELYKTDSQVPVFMDNLSLGKSKTVGDLELTFVRERQFTGLQVSKDPGGWMIWLAGTLLVIGMSLVFYFPYRRLWAMAHRTPEGKTEVLVGATAGRDLTFHSEFAQVTELMQTQLRGAAKSEERRR